MPIENGVETTLDRVDEMLRSVTFLTDHKVMVGIPAANASRHDGQINNAALGYIHEFGSPIHNIPPRPWLFPAVNAMQHEAAKRLEKAADLAFDGKKNDALHALNALGLWAQAEVKKHVVEGPFAPLRPATLAARRRAGRRGTKPLLDTTQMFNAIGYVVK